MNIIGNSTYTLEDLRRINEPYDKMLLDGLKVFLAELKFAGIEIRMPGQAYTWDPFIRIMMPKGEVRLNWASHKRRWKVEVFKQDQWELEMQKIKYFKDIEKTEPLIRDWIHELKQ